MKVLGKIQWNVHIKINEPSYLSFEIDNWANPIPYITWCNKNSCCGYSWTPLQLQGYFLEIKFVFTQVQPYLTPPKNAVCTMQTIPCVFPLAELSPTETNSYQAHHSVIPMQTIWENSCTKKRILTVHLVDKRLKQEPLGWSLLRNHALSEIFST